MSFWSNDEFSGTSKSDRKRLSSIFTKKSSSFGAKRIRYYILVPILVLVAGWLLILPFFLNQDSPRRNGTVGQSSNNFNESVILAADRVKPAVVSVISLPPEQEVEGAEAQEQVPYGLGSGIIIRVEGKKAFIVTNQHVIEGAATINVVLTDGEQRKAKLIGADRDTDLAVLQIDSKDITVVAKFGDSDQLKAGESAIAIGNPLGLGYSQTITAGIISVPLRTVPVSRYRDGQLDWELDLIQTDAAINRGNSGGALVNLDGLVIGINSLKVTDFGVEGLGFAIPSNQALPIIDSLLEFGRVKRPFLGVSTTDLGSFVGGTESLKLPADVEKGIIVLEATGPAGEAGMLTGDVIVQLDDRAVGTTLELRKYLYFEKKIGDEVEVGFYRENRRGSVMMTLVEREPEG